MRAQPRILRKRLDRLSIECGVLGVSQGRGASHDESVGAVDQGQQMIVEEPVKVGPEKDAVPSVVRRSVRLGGFCRQLALATAA